MSRDHAYLLDILESARIACQDIANRQRDEFEQTFNARMRLSGVWRLSEKPPIGYQTIHNPDCHNFPGGR
jgi:hypothetical protein